MQFQTTRWTLIAAVRTAPAEAEIALAQLCATYWPPVYAFVRRKGYSEEDAKDLTQDFFAFLIDKGVVAKADQNRGKFRTFLLASVNNFLANEWDRRIAQKRGGQVKIVPMDGAPPIAAANGSPERVFERQWVLTILENALARLERDENTPDQSRRFEALKDYLAGGAVVVPYADIAKELGMTDNAVKVAVHRLRKKYAQAIREEVAETLLEGEDVEEEIRYLLDVLGD